MTEERVLPKKLKDARVAGRARVFGCGGREFDAGGGILMVNDGWALGQPQAGSRNQRADDVTGVQRVFSADNRMETRGPPSYTKTNFPFRDANGPSTAAPPEVSIPKRRAANKKTSKDHTSQANPVAPVQKNRKKAPKSDTAAPDADAPAPLARRESEVGREETRAALEKAGIRLPAASAAASPGQQQPSRPKPRPVPPKAKAARAAASAAQSDLAADTFNLSHRRSAKRASPTEPTDAPVVGGTTVLAGDAPAIFTPEDQYLFADRTVLVYDDVDVDEDLENWIGNGQAPATAPADRPLMRIKDLKDWINNSQSASISPAPRRRCSSRSPTPAASHRSPSRGRSPTPRTLTNGPHTPASPRARLPTPAAAERTPSRGRSPTPRTPTPRTRTPHPRAPLRSPPKPLSSSSSRSRSPVRSPPAPPSHGPRLRARKPVEYEPPSPGARSDGPPSSDEYGDELRREQRIKERDLARGDQPRRSVEDEDEEDEEDFEREIERGELDDDEEPGPSTRKKGSKKKAAPGAKQKRVSTTVEKGKETGKGKGKAKKPHDADADNSDDDDGAADRRAAKGKAKAREKAKAKAKKASPLADDDEDDDDGGEGDDSESKSKSGAVSEEIRQRLAQLNDKHEADVAAIAREIGKPVTLLHQILGDLIKTPRALTAWNVWQRWFSESHPNDEHLGGPAYTDKSRAAFLKALRDVEGYPDFEDEKPPTTKESFERLPWLLEWDRNLTEQAVLMFREDGKLKPKLKKELVPVLQIAEKLRKTFGVQLWGFVIDPKGDASFMWGSGDDFKEMRATHLISLTDICKNQEHIFGSIDLRKRGLAPQALPAIEEAAGSGGKRDRYRSQLGTILGSQLWGYCKANGTLTGHDVDPSKYQMKWSTKFVDVAFENQVRLINYPAALKDAGQIIGTGGFKLKDITVPLFDAFMPDLIIANRPRDPDDMELDDEVMKIVRWTDEERALPLDDQRDIPLVVGPDNAALLCVKSSSAYSHRMEETRRKATKAAAKAARKEARKADKLKNPRRRPASRSLSAAGARRSRSSASRSASPRTRPHSPSRSRSPRRPSPSPSRSPPRRPSPSPSRSPPRRRSRSRSPSRRRRVHRSPSAAHRHHKSTLKSPRPTQRTRTPERAAPRAGPSQKPHKSSRADDREGGPRLDFTHVGKGGAPTVVPQDGRDRSGKHKAAEREAPRRHKDDDRVHGTKRKAADNGEGDDRESKRAKRKEEEGRRSARAEQDRGGPAPPDRLKMTLTFANARSFYATGLAPVAHSSRVDRATLLWSTAGNKWTTLPDNFTPILATEEDRGRYQRNIEEFALYEHER